MGWERETSNTNLSNEENLRYMEASSGRTWEALLGDQMDAQPHFTAYM